MKRLNSSIKKTLPAIWTRSARDVTGSRRSRMLEGHKRGEVNISTTDSPWPPPMSSQEFSPHVYVLKKVDGSRLGGCCRGLRLCNRSNSTMWLHGCASTLRGKNRVTKAPELKHATWCSSSLLISLLLLSLSCSQQAARGYPIGSLRVVAVPSHLFTLQPVSQPSLSYPRAECVPCQFY